MIRISGILILIRLLIIVSPVSGQAIDPGELNRITVSNSTGFQLRYLFYSPTDSKNWGPDLLSQDGGLVDGGRLRFYIHYPGLESSFSFLAVDEDFDMYRIDRFPVSNGREAYLDIRLENYLGPGKEMEFRELVLTNNSRTDIWYLFLSPSDSITWGVDILDDESVFIAGDSRRLIFPAVGEFTPYDLLAIDQENSALYARLRLNEDSDTWNVEISEEDRR
ncbi:hypothetical protein [Salinispira pacifica]|uniref:Uncharacterized protein n=1 Tax=Salinispira pacifica TaxID=1307761 RepID=V5WFS3_9SPIO|nr:hypothetical protein [Salinispira pacifica]AHC14672.1 hypothetical protein L21SP2_1271 [Salinispira pacifica]